MHMRDQDGIEGIAVRRIHCPAATLDVTDPVAEHRISQNANAVDLNENGRVSYVGNM